MWLLVFFILQIPSVNVVRTSKPPALDGVVDGVWRIADSIFEFHQFEPDWGKPPRYRTVVKFLQDDKNLYVLAIAYTGKDHPAVKASESEDRITIYLDTFLSRQEAYFFSVTAGGTQYDGIISDNGNRWNMSWEGYWFAKTKVYPHKYVVEIKIPFRSIRYARDKTTWGLQVRRYIPKFLENDYWSLPPREKEDEVSQYGLLKNIHPKSYGYGMEFYPVGILKREKYGNVSPQNSLLYGLDYTWNITSDAQLNLTFKPDFAQIEADPFALNLSKYERYLEERRPFFIEANEVFKTTRLNFGSGMIGSFNVFYSRRIGRKLPDGTDVPINFGSKFTFKASGYQFGMLSVYTGGKDYLIDTVTYREPPVLWNVVRFKANLFSESPMGVLIASKWSDPWGKKQISTNYDIDGKFVNGPLTSAYQIVGSSPAEGKSGFGGILSEAYITRNLVAVMNFQYVDENLDLSSTGYMNTDPGYRTSGFLGRKKYFSEGEILSCTNGLIFLFNKTSGEPVFEKFMSIYTNFELRSGYYGGAYGGIGNSYDYGENRTTYSAHLELGKSGGKYRYGTWNNLNKGWNYNLGIFSWQLIGGVWSEIPISATISSGLRLRYWVEFDTTNSVHDIYTTIRPWARWSITRDVSLTLSSEIVGIKTDVWEVEEARLGLRLVYKFRPKSRIYVVANRHLAKYGSSLESDEEFYALKIRWAIPF